MHADLPLMTQTTYAELLDQVRGRALVDDFTADGVFTPKTVRGRRYWYFQESTALGRGQKYVGPETPDLLERINSHNAARTYQRDRRGLVALLVRGGNLPSPHPAIGVLVGALADAGVFRLRGVLVGTVAYQTYAAMLGVRLAAAAVQTNDVDVAQFAAVSTAIDDMTRPLGDVLRDADPTFHPVPHLDAKRAVTYRAASGLRVDFLTPNRGPDNDEPQYLPTFGVDAQRLRFLDFLLRDPELAVILHGQGVLVSVPSPERFAIHKLIVARRRRSEEETKRRKDLAQAQALLEVLVERRPTELRTAWAEAFRRGKVWRRLIGEGMGQLHPAIRDRTLQVVEAPRKIIPGIELRFAPNRAVYDSGVNAVRFFAIVTSSHNAASTEGIVCLAGAEFVSSAVHLDTLVQKDLMTTFKKFRHRFEQAARIKYLTGKIDAPGEVWLSESDREIFVETP